MEYQGILGVWLLGGCVRDKGSYTRLDRPGLAVADYLNYLYSMLHQIDKYIQ